jgi:hypothetical protein
LLRLYQIGINKYTHNCPLCKRKENNEVHNIKEGGIELSDVDTAFQNIILSSGISNNDKTKEIEGILQKHNKTIYTDDENYKSFLDILEMLSEIWNNNLDL